MSRKDLLKLDNEFLDELPKYSRKPNITQLGKPSLLTGRVTAFLEKAGKQNDVNSNQQGSSSASSVKSTNGDRENNSIVEMDVYITPTSD